MCVAPVKNSQTFGTAFFEPLFRSHHALWELTVYFRTEKVSHFSAQHKKFIYFKLFFENNLNQINDRIESDLNTFFSIFILHFNNHSFSNELIIKIFSNEIM